VAAAVPAPPATLPVCSDPSLHRTGPVASANLNMTSASRAQGATQASTMLRSSAAAFTPGETVHQTPIKTTGAAAAAADEDEELCAWLQQKVSLTQRVVDKVLPSEQEC
jgi:hypothetical protein